MSWSVNYTGSPTKVVAALKKYSEQMGTSGSNPSKDEFDAALPALITLIEANDETKIVKLAANGSAWTGSDGVKSANCGVTLESIYILP